MSRSSAKSCQEPDRHTLMYPDTLWHSTRPYPGGDIFQNSGSITVINKVPLKGCWLPWFHVFWLKTNFACSPHLHCYLRESHFGKVTLMSWAQNACCWNVLLISLDNTKWGSTILWYGRCLAWRFDPTQWGSPWADRLTRTALGQCVTSAHLCSHLICRPVFLSS